MERSAEWESTPDIHPFPATPEEMHYYLKAETKFGSRAEYRALDPRKMPRVWVGRLETDVIIVFEADPFSVTFKPGGDGEWLIVDRLRPSERIGRGFRLHDLIRRGVSL